MHQWCPSLTPSWNVFPDAHFVEYVKYFSNKVFDTYLLSFWTSSHISLKPITLIQL